MRLLEKLMALSATLTEVLEELGVSPAEQETPEPEILLTRSKRNRRSDENKVMTMAPLNGAPAVPEGWAQRKSTSKRGSENRETLAMILRDYEPMTLRDVWHTSRALCSRLEDAKQQQNFQQMVRRLIRLKQLKIGRGGILVRKG